jgi:hypothetical protein
VATGPIVKGVADGALKGHVRRQVFFGEEGGPEVGIGREVGVVPVLFQELVAVVVDDVLKVAPTGRGGMARTL